MEDETLIDDEVERDDSYMILHMRLLTILHTLLQYEQDELE